MEYQRRQVLDHINQALVDNFIKDNPFERFYNEATRGFSNREKNYIEDHFVDSTGRRNSLPESDFLYHVKNGSKLLEGNARILQRISTSSDGSSYRVELIHDSFCEPLVFLKEKRERQNRIKRIATAAATFFLLLGIIGSFVYLLNKLEDEKIQRTKAEKKVKVHEDFKKLEASISLIPTYIDDDIKYSNYGFSERSDLDDWKSENEELCRSKISNLLSDSLKTLKIKKEMKDSEPALVYLILKSQSLKTIHEKQEWFEMWDIMNDEQVFKLYDILTRERYKLSVLSYKDNAAILNNEAYRHAQNGNFDEALSTIDKSIEKARVAYANKYDTKGEILLMKGNTQEAVKMWNKVLDISPNFLDYYDGSTPFYEQLRKRGLIE